MAQVSGSPTQVSELPILNVPQLVLLALAVRGVCAHDGGQHYIDQHGDKECPSQNIYGSAPPNGLDHDLI